MKLGFTIVLIMALGALCDAPADRGTTTSKTSDRQSAIVVNAPDQGEPGYFVNEAGDTIQRISKTADEWKAELTEMEYYVLREEGTERAFTGDLLKEKRPGDFVCAACGLVLFETETKFKSGTGWPSFYEPADATHVGEEKDQSYGMVRTEVHCNRCGGHLGHVFNDGPAPTGLRYCINAAALDFEAQ